MNTSGNDFEDMRRNMVSSQLAGRDIKDRKILDVFQKVPRHRFVGPRFYKDAYGDFPLPIGSNQTISQPYMVALMAQLLDIRKTDRVLEIGTGSGYEAAIIAELAKDVFSVERLGELAEKAGAVLRDLGYKNIIIKTGDGTLGWKEFSPFDKIIVSASSEQVPKPLIEQLRPGGRIVIPLGPKFAQALLLAEKTAKGDIVEKNICDCAFVPLVGQYGRKADNAGKDI